MKFVFKIAISRNFTEHTNKTYKQKLPPKKVKKRGKQKKNYLIPILIALVILTAILSGLFFMNKEKDSSKNSEDEFFKCLSKVSTLYLQKGCPYCTNQKNILGDGIKYLNTVDCMREEEKCSQIPGTPTWIVDGKMLLGVQSIEKLKSASGC